MKTTETATGMPAKPTNGILFDDGAAIDRLRGGSLVICHKGKTIDGRCIAYEGSNYEATPLNPSLEAMINFPSRAEEFGTADRLLSDLESTILKYIGLDENDARLLAFSILSTHVPECIPNVPIINIWGSRGAETRAIDFLSCVCRRPLFLADAPAREVLRLPPDLRCTLILRSPNPRNLQSLTVVSNAGAVIRDGVASSFCWPIVIATTEPVQFPALRIQMSPAMSYCRLLASETEALRESFQGKLLTFRLQRHRNVGASRFDVPAFAPETRLLAATLGAVVEGFPEIQARLTDWLRSKDEEEKAELSQDRAAIVLEALLAKCHLGDKVAYVGDIANLANAIFLGRQVDSELSPRGVGDLLRRQLGLTAKRDGAGYAVRLDRSTKVQIHRLAYRFGALSVLKPFPDCTFCNDLQQGKQTDINVHNVHDIHDREGDGGKQ